MLKEYVQKNGWDGFRRELVIAGVPVGAWAKGVRRSYKHGVIANWLRQALEGIPGWTWERRGESVERRNLELLRGYVEVHGWHELRNDTVYSGVELGKWIARRRGEYADGVLPAWIRSELESLPGWTVDPVSERQRRKLDLLKALIEAHGWGELRQDTLADGVRIGQWVQSKRQARRDGELPSWLAEELEAIPGWSWDGSVTASYRRSKGLPGTVEEAYRRNLDLLKQFVEQQGWDEFRSNTVHEGIRLGLWVTNCRARRETTLPAWVQQELESIPGWSWDPVTDRHHRNLRLLREFVERNGWRAFRQQTVVDGARLGQWVSCRREDYKKGEIPSWLKEELERIAGWSAELRRIRKL